MYEVQVKMYVRFNVDARSAATAQIEAVSEALNLIQGRTGEKGAVLMLPQACATLEDVDSVEVTLVRDTSVPASNHEEATKELRALLGLA